MSYLERIPGFAALSGIIKTIRWPHLILAAVAFGVLLRLVHFGFGRMLWLDEATIAINFLVRDGVDYFEALEFRQIAPPIWMMVSDGLWSFTGNLEYGGRLLSLLAGLTAFILFWRLARERFSSPIVLIAVAVFAFSYMPVYYSAEIKPYIFDLLFCVIVLVQGLRLFEKDDWRLSDSLWLGVTLILTSCFAMAAPMIIGGFGGILGLKALTERRWHAVIILAASGAIAALIYAIPALSAFQVQIDQSGLDQGGMGNYFQRHFAPFPPTSLGDLAWYVEIVQDTLTPMVGRESNYAYVILALFGSVIVARQSMWKFAFIIAPIVVGLVLSAAHVYPIMARLALYIFPIALLLAAFALEKLISELPKRVNWIVVAAIALMSIGSVTWYRYYNLFNPTADPKDMSQELQTIADEITPDEILVVTSWSLPAFLLYRHAYGLDQVNWTVADRVDCFFEPPIDIENRSRVWFLRGQFEGPGPRQTTPTYDLILDDVPKRIDVKTIDNRMDRLKYVDSASSDALAGECQSRIVEDNLLFGGRPPL